MFSAFSPVISGIILIVILGVLITVHEWGHYILAKLTGVDVLEFAIGMGPAILTRQKKDEDGNPCGTKFSIRAFPIGGYCAMEGEDQSSENPHAFNNRPVWARFLVLAAGAFMNFVLGVLLLLVLYSSAIGGQMLTATLGGFMDGFAFEGEQGLMQGDQILEINGNNIFSPAMDIPLFLERGEGEPYDFVVKRDGKRVVITNLPLVKHQYGDEMKFGLIREVEQIGVEQVLKYSWLEAVDYVRLVWLSLGDLISGRAGVGEMMGFVGMGTQINEVVSDTSVPLRSMVMYLLRMAALIAVNLAIMNLLPLPALDGGRIVFVLIETVRRKPIPPKYEGYVHAAGMVLLLVLMVFLFFNDIVRAVTGNPFGG